MFQYISCYSLSAWKAKGLALHTSFNTSHITLYQTSGTGTDRRKQVSIHLMLLFIGKGCSNFSCLYTFQYISCYSLSLPLTGFRCWLLRFNTSHVTLYRVSESDTFRTLWTFQYISCYSLSKKSCIHICCFMVSIHLMLLFIRRSRQKLQKGTSVSIHLMLLFIPFPHISRR